MPDVPPADLAATPSLGQELRRIRLLHGFTLMDVERAVGVSNAYLSQVETGKIEKPSPAKLYSLAELYHVSYDQLMETAGYITKRADTSAKSSDTLAGAAFSSLQELTADEKDALAQYLAAYRIMKKNNFG